MTQRPPLIVAFALCEFREGGLHLGNKNSNHEKTNDEDVNVR